MHISQAAVDGGVTHGELFVFDAELMEDGGVDVVDLRGGAGVLRFVTPLVALAMGPPLMPPPQSQLVKTKGLWSRPVVRWAQGMRPNSVVHRMIVSSACRVVSGPDQPGVAKAMPPGGTVIAIHVFVRIPVAARGIRFRCR